jgi:hypothetical protein
VFGDLMGDVDDTFASIMTIVQSLESDWMQANDDSEREHVKEKIDRLFQGLTGQQLVAFTEYQKERVKQADQGLGQSEKMLHEAEAELRKRHP